MLNSCNFIGRIGQDPEVRYAANGNAIANISVGCSESWRDKNTGEKVEKTEWVRGSAFGKLAEIIGEYLHKGALVYISGKMQTRKWQDQNGQDKYTTEIVINEMKMLSSKQGSQNNQQQQARLQQQTTQQQASQSQPKYNEPPQDFDDDIPFGYIGIQYPNNLLHCI